jgi:hypothetical protein
VWKWDKEILSSHFKAIDSIPSYAGQGSENEGEKTCQLGELTYSNEDSQVG